MSLELMIGLKIMIDKSKSVLLIGSDGFLGNCFRDILTENGNEFYVMIFKTEMTFVTQSIYQDMIMLSIVRE